MSNSKLFKNDLIKSIADGHGTSQDSVRATVDAFLSSIESGLEQGNDVTIQGFGSFVHRQRAARKGRNPRTGEAIEVAASNSVSFKPAAALKSKMN